MVFLSTLKTYFFYLFKRNQKKIWSLWCVSIGCSITTTLQRTSGLENEWMDGYKFNIQYIQVINMIARLFILWMPKVKSTTTKQDFEIYVFIIICDVVHSHKLLPIPKWYFLECEDAETYILTFLSHTVVKYWPFNKDDILCKFSIY